MAKNKKFDEEKEFNELASSSTINSENELLFVKRTVQAMFPDQKALSVRAMNNKQKDLINSIRNNEITICAGQPGSGKTFVSVALALSLLRKQENRFKKIYLVKSVTALKGEELGFLKGDFKEKIEPFMWSYFINMEKITTKATINNLMEADIVRPFPLAYMRGASLDDCIIIADEMQNISFDNSRTLMTRIGSNCKLIILGDINQVDLKFKDDSSLDKLLEIFIDTPNIGVIKMSEEDTNVRNPLISIIENKFNTYNEENGK